MPAVGPPPDPVTVTVKLSSGASYSGTLKHIDDFSVSLNDRTANIIPGCAIETPA